MRRGEDREVLTVNKTYQIKRITMFSYTGNTERNVRKQAH
jgi:hypothetical protein